MHCAQFPLLAQGSNRSEVDARVSIAKFGGWKVPGIGRLGRLILLVLFQSVALDPGSCSTKMLLWLTYLIHHGCT